MRRLSTQVFRGSLSVAMALALPLVGTACDGRAVGGEGEADPSVTGAVGPGATCSPLPELPDVYTDIKDSLQIDQANLGDLTNPADANLFSGADPADGSASFNHPLGGPGSYLDWNDLVPGQHQILDLDVGGKDPTSFPQSNECLGPSNVLAKMDIMYVAAASNNVAGYDKYAYFAVLRRNNNGDAGWYWLFTEKPTNFECGAGPCSATQYRVTYDITGSASGPSDVLLTGHFKPNGAPFLRVFRAKENRAGVPATAAIDFTDATLWEEDASAVAAAAVNTTITDPGAFGAPGGTATTGGDLVSEIFEEVAVPLSVFTGGNACGATYYGSVITRSSGSGGTSPDLKDFVRGRFKFGGVQTSATLTNSCGYGVHYKADVTDLAGSPIQGASCHWVFDDGTERSDCEGDVDLAAGSRTATLTVDLDGCQASATSNTVLVCPPLGVTAGLTATCNSSVGYDATPSGGCGNVTYSWAFSGGPTTPAASSTKSGSFAVGTPGLTYRGDVTVTDTRTDRVCTQSSFDTAVPYAPLVVTLTPSATNLQCPTDTDAITYTPVVSYGSGTIAGYTWNTVSKNPASLPDLPCAGSSCIVNPADDAFCAEYQLSVTVTDGLALCGSATSEIESYTKTTSVTSSNL